MYIFIIHFLKNVKKKILFIFSKILENEYCVLLSANLCFHTENVCLKLKLNFVLLCVNDSCVFLMNF